MGQGTTGVDPRAQAQEAERAVEKTRERLTGIIRELDRRRHAALDLRGQLARHGVAVGVSAGMLALLIGGAVWLGVRRHARQQRPLARARRLRGAVARVIAHPDDVAKPTPDVSKKVLGAFGSAAAGVLAKTLAQRLLSRPKAATDRGRN